MTIWKPKKSPYYHFDFQRGGRRYYGTTKRKTEREAQAVEDAEIQRAELAAERNVSMTLHVRSVERTS
jgi:hypothetical protein